MQVALQGNNAPDVFFQRGRRVHGHAGQVRQDQEPDRVRVELIGELGSQAQAWQIGGKQYGIPYDLHMVGFWYRKDLFAKAGIAAPPATMPELKPTSPS